MVHMVQGNEVTVAEAVRLGGLDAPYVILDIEPEAGIAYLLPIDVSQVRTSSLIGLFLSRTNGL